ncbi:hypothetical protein A2U01_0093592, partial [Trifolium medium]|nr:hypothetical protein [Trifolium medium]
RVQKRTKVNKSPPCEQCMREVQPGLTWRANGRGLNRHRQGKGSKAQHQGQRGA